MQIVELQHQVAVAEECKRDAAKLRSELDKQLQLFQVSPFVFCGVS